MLRLAIAASIAAAAIHAPAFAQDGLNIDRPAIIVAGSGSVERDPDQFTVTATVRGQGSDQVAALRAFDQTQARVLDGLRRLEGLNSAEVTSGNVATNPVYSPDCAVEPWRDPEPSCPIIGYVAEMTVKLVGSPIERAGDAVSLAAERGATQARIERFGVADTDILRDEAMRAAVLDARRQADILADASGQRIVRVLRIMHGDQYGGAAYEMAIHAAEDATDAAAAAAPAVRVQLTPEPITYDAQVIVAFEIE